MFDADIESGDHLERMDPVFLLMGAKLWHMEAQGCGVSAKLANNYILAINNIATSEVLNMD
jgi:3-hydroxyisobutyrate dehydrogenase